MPIATVTSKGQIAVPALIRKRLGIVKGTRLFVEEREGEILLKPLTPEYLDRMAGVLKGSSSLSKKLLEERAADANRDL